MRNRKFSTLFIISMSVLFLGFGWGGTARLNSFEIWNLKKISNPSNPDSGELKIFANSEGQIQKLDENGNLAPLGGGAETPDIKHVETFEITKPDAYFTCTGGLTVSNDTTTQISEKQSAKITQVSAVATDYCESIPLDVSDEDFHTDDMALKIFSKTNAATNGDYSLEFFVSADNITYTSLYSGVYGVDTGLKDHMFRFELKDTHKWLKFRIYPTTPNDANILSLDKVRIDLDPDLTAKDVESETIEYLGYTSLGTQNYMLLPTEGVNTSKNLVKVTHSDHTRYTFLAKSNFTAVGAYNSTVNVYVIVDWYDKNDNHVKRSYETAGAAGTAVSTMIGIAEAGDYLRFATGTSSTNDNSTNFSVTATRTSLTKVVKGSTSALDTNDSGPVVIGAVTTAPTKGTTAHDKMFWRRVGDSMEIRVEYEQTGSGAAGSGDYLLSIPSGYKIDTSKISRLSGSNSDVRGAEVGQGSIGSANGENNVNNRIAASVSVYSDTQVRLHVQNTGGLRYTINWGSDSFNLTNSVLNMYATFTVPIEGWSASDIVHQVPIGDKTENVYSARIANNGVSTFKATPRGGFSNNSLISRLGTGRTRVIYTTGFFNGETPIGFVTTQVVNNYYASIEAESDASIIIETRRSDTGAFVDVDFNLFLVRDGSDYREPKGVLVSSVKVNRKTDGSEIEEDYLLDGQKVYSRTWKVDADISSNTVIATIDTNLKIINKMSVSPGVFLVGGSNYTLQLANYAFITYTQATGVISTIQNGETLRAGMTLTIEYTK